MVALKTTPSHKTAHHSVFKETSSEKTVNTPVPKRSPNTVIRPTLISCRLTVPVNVYTKHLFILTLTTFYKQFALRYANSKITITRTQSKSNSPKLQKPRTTTIRPKRTCNTITRIVLVQKRNAILHSFILLHVIATFAWQRAAWHSKTFSWKSIDSCTTANICSL